MREYSVIIMIGEGRSDRHEIHSAEYEVKNSTQPLLRASKLLGCSRNSQDERRVKVLFHSIARTTSHSAIIDSKGHDYTEVVPFER